MFPLNDTVRTDFAFLRLQGWKIVIRSVFFPASGVNELMAHWTIIHKHAGWEFTVVTLPALALYSHLGFSKGFVPPKKN